MSTKMQVEWRRTKVIELLSKGNSQSDIAKTLQVDLSIISRDVYFLRQQTKDNIKKYIDERLPEEYEKCLVGLNALQRKHGIHRSRQCYQWSKTGWASSFIRNRVYGLRLRSRPSLLNLAWRCSWFAVTYRYPSV